jgi:hypothetical protein
MAAEASKAAPLPKLALHFAVWDDNVNQLEALLVRKDIGKAVYLTLLRNTSSCTTNITPRLEHLVT